MSRVCRRNFKKFDTQAGAGRRADAPVHSREAPMGQSHIRSNSLKILRPKMRLLKAVGSATRSNNEPRAERDRNRGQAPQPGIAPVLFVAP